MMRTKSLLFLIFLVLTCVSCRQSATNDEPLWTLSVEQQDSLTFARTRHFSVGYNFRVIADSLTLYAEIPAMQMGLERGDSVMVYATEPLVVAEMRKVPADSVSEFWIKVARDQESMGWTAEADLLRSVVPVDPISRFIHTFSNRRLVAGAVVILLAAVVLLYRKVKRGRMHMILVRDIASFYPTSVCLCTAVAAVLYRAVLAFSPDAWAEFYHYPSLNPFLWSPWLGAFIASVWLWLILLLAACDEIRRSLPPFEAIVYFMGLVSVSLSLYLFFSFLPSVWWCLVCFIPCAAFIVWKWYKQGSTNLLCGHCGRPVKGQGRCPHCGTWNK